MLLLFGCATTPGGLVEAPSGETADSPAPDDTGDAAGESGEESGGDSDASKDTTWALPDRPDVDHPAATDSWRYGGGLGYPDVVDPTWPVVSRVSDVAGLTAALAAAAAGDIVYVDDGAELDLTGLAVCIPAGVWLAGGRGVDGADGALLYATVGGATAMLSTCGEDVRITGLRLRGPDPETCPPEWPDNCPNDVSSDSNCAYCTDTAYGISTTYARLEVDNNELSGWTYAAVGVHDAVDADVHHDHIHHGWREGLGYGVVLYGSAPTSALVRWNRFEAMRHVVAGQGYPSEDYEARDNLVEPSAISHVFDMHGEDEATGDGTSYAGGTIDIHGNIVLVADQYSLVVRGRPETGSWLYENCLAPGESSAYDQRYFTGNFTVDEAPDGRSAPNAYGQSPGACGTLHWCLADRTTGPVRYGSASGTPASELLVGDLDGDGQDDVFGTTGTTWRYANPDGGAWTSLAASGATLGDLALADLDGDGREDVFYADGSTWYWSRSGTASFASLKASAYRREDVAFGDFDGDGAVDVFTASGSRWSYHPRGSGAPVDLASSSTRVSQLALADLDGDGVTDVFYGDGSTWRWSRSGSASWADLAVSSATVGSLALADVDGNGIADVLSVTNERLRVSWGGRTSWEVLRYQRDPLDTLRLGDFDGDGRADVLTGGCL